MKGAIPTRLSKSVFKSVSIRAPVKGAIVGGFWVGFAGVASFVCANLVLVVSKSVWLCWRRRRPLGVRARLEDERAFDVVVIVFAVVFDLLLPVFSKVVDSNAVGFFVDDGEEFGSEFDELGGVDFAFEDGVLDALAVVETGFGDFAESGLAAFVDG